MNRDRDRGLSEEEKKNRKIKYSRNWYQNMFEERQSHKHLAKNTEKISMKICQNKTSKRRKST